MWNKMKYLVFSLMMMLALLFTGCQVTVNVGSGEEETTTKTELSTVQDSEDDADEQNDTATSTVTEDGEYTSKEEVAEYLHLYGHLPSNFITKKEAQKLGWVSKEGNLSEVAPGKSIGGDTFGNREGILPKGKKYKECDIDSDGGYRNSKRIVFSDDGCIYYTEDHYESFELLYGEE